MSLVINTNPLSLNAQRHAAKAQLSLNSAIERLSSGKRINSAKDDAAGLAISNRFTAQIRGTYTAERNSNDAISLLQTAEGALISVSSNLQRVRELAVQAANGTNSSEDRQAVQQEVSQLLDEVERVASSAEFNGHPLFSGSAPGDADQQAILDNLRSWLSNSEALIRERYGLGGDNVSLDVDLTTFSDGAGGRLAQVVSNTYNSGSPPEGFNLRLQVDLADFAADGGQGRAPFFNDRVIAHELAHAVHARTSNWASFRNVLSPDGSPNGATWFVEAVAEVIHGADERLVHYDAAGIDAVANALENGWQGGHLDYAAAYAAGRFLHDKIKTNTGGAEGFQDLLQYMDDDHTRTLDQALAAKAGYADNNAFLADFKANGANFINTKLNLQNADTGSIGGLDADGGPERTAVTTVPDTPGSGELTGFMVNYPTTDGTGGAPKIFQFQVGANSGDTLQVNLGALSLSALGLSGLDLSAYDHASGTLSRLDRALAFVTDKRGLIGANLNRFESVVSVLQTQSQNLSTARSRILDADYAVETAALSRSQILQQASTAMVAQANTVPSQVLTLLRA